MSFEIRKNYHQKNYHKFILFIYLFLKTFWVVHSKKKGGMVRINPSRELEKFVVVFVVASLLLINKIQQSIGSANINHLQTRVL